MASSYSTDYSYREQTAEQADIVRDSLKEFGEMQTQRAILNQQYEEIARLIDPPASNTFFFGSWNPEGTKKTQSQVDATGMMALERFSSICNSLITPRNQTWHGLAASDPYLMKDRSVKLYYEEVNRIIFDMRYDPRSNFSAQNQRLYKNIGAYGKAGMFIDELDGADGSPGFRYKTIDPGNLYIKQNHQGIVDGFIEPFQMTARQAAQKWGKENIPPQLRAAYEQFSESLYWFLHRVCPRKDYDPQRADAKGKKFASFYISMEGQWLMSEGGYRTFPLPASIFGGDGVSPAQKVLPALKTLNAEKRVFLKQGHRAADPVLLTRDDGLVGFSVRPGALNKGGMNSDGKRLVDILPTGEIQVTLEMMNEERTLIKDAFLVSLFQMLEKNPQMTATEVVERTNEKGILIAPTVGSLQDDRGPQIEREIDIAVSQGKLPPMPPILREAQGEYKVVYTSPLAKSMRAQDVAGFMRTVEQAKEIVAITQDPSFLDTFSFDRALPAIAEIQSVPTEWMAAKDEIEQKRSARAKQAQIQQQIQAAPAAAALMKVKAEQAPAQGA